MFNLEDIQEIEIELTTQCQASCPMCSRNFHGLVPNNNVKNISWNLQEYKTIMNQEVLRNVKNIIFCGSYGDPLVCRDIEKICRYTKENSNAHLCIHTNASLYTEKWWANFAKSLPENHTVEFAIDGFKENHEKHRKGTDFDKIIKNAKAFIASNGNVDAKFLSFAHNRDDFDDLKEYLLSIGVQNVFKKFSSRFRHDNFKVLDKDYKEIDRLSPDDNSKAVNFKDDQFPSVLEKASKSNIKCQSIHDKKIYIDAYKHLYPCCHTANIRYEVERIDEPNFNRVLPEVKKQISDIHKEYNNIGYIDLRKTPIKNVLHDSNYRKIWEKYWRFKKSFVCNVVCGKVQNRRFFNPDSQYYQ